MTRFRNMLNDVAHGNCIDVMGAMPWACVDFILTDPPYIVNYRDRQGRSLANDDNDTWLKPAFRAMHRVLRPDRHMAMYVSDSFVKGAGFYPIGFELFQRLRQVFEPVDIIAVARRNKTLEMGNYRKAAEEGNFFLRGFNYLFIMHKQQARGRGVQSPGRRALASSPGTPGED